ncbi:acyl-CoA carboxylase subunit epsilon [Streptomyces phaeoluteigriseus]|uniref:Acyl-CoA carboxylase subunit epsilon n=1 Tax=Streptomyces phaeoluteigriseus TaxID=114686 RepID=A0ABY4Z6S3_9ACTN|nr:acyl-CoA carboxylase epsilon subunit [Streptomyces phaeoluteigriseus]USQ84469.1 acyl-CoA carboxylase subunit epsilon [Streptomyces phaeoluteigriseus]
MTTAPFAPFASSEPLIRVERGTAGPAELAALTAVLLHRAAYGADAAAVAEECRAPAPRWRRAGTRHAAGTPLSWRSAPVRDAARRPWQG